MADFGKDFLQNLQESKRLIGMVPQNSNLDRDLTAYENLYLHTLLHNIPKSQRKSKIEDALEFAGLSDYKYQQAKTFSGGMKRMDWKLDVVPVGPLQMNAAILSAEGLDGIETILIDPGEEPERLLGLVRDTGGTLRYLLATHGHFDRNPQKSFLLTYDDKLTMDALSDSIGGRRYKGEPLELLVLSACETAAGDKRAALGLAGVALKAGARSALATLWQISDEATVKIITEFYLNTNQPELSKAQALQLSQVKLLKQERFRHPTDWAPFLLIGNWL